MRLADFIESSIEPILKQWEVFAATQLPAAASMDSLALRDHAEQILEAVAKDLRTYQSRDVQIAKSQGFVSTIAAPETAAQTHAVLRAKSGFVINQLAAEYRALRASVLRLWKDAARRPADTDFDDMLRFNEAIDQALCESIDFFTAQVERERNLFLAVLGHDLRSPLQTIHTTARYLSALNLGDNVSTSAARLIRSSSRMQALLNDLVDFKRTQLGLAISLTPTEVDAAALLAAEVERLQSTHPNCQLVLQAAGDLRGIWDGARLQQLLCNLVVNAIKYGAPDSPVHVTVTGSPGEIRLDVLNRGPGFDEATLPALFEPLQRGPLRSNEPDSDSENMSIGLGLYIVREIAVGHGGSIDARSNPEETVFTVRLPRRR